jgi:hypothetical protein
VETVGSKPAGAKIGASAKRPEKAHGPFPIDAPLGLAGDQNPRIAGVSYRDADCDSIRGHHDRFVYRRQRLTRYYTRD